MLIARLVATGLLFAGAGALPVQAVGSFGTPTAGVALAPHPSALLVAQSPAEVMRQVAARRKGSVQVLELPLDPSAPLGEADGLPVIAFGQRTVYTGCPTLEQAEELLRREEIASRVSKYCSTDLKNSSVRSARCLPPGCADWNSTRMPFASSMSTPKSTSITPNSCVRAHDPPHPQHRSGWGGRGRVLNPKKRRTNRCAALVTLQPVATAAAR